MKNHRKVNGKLVQTNKRFFQLNEKQKRWIVEEIDILYHHRMKEKRTTRKLSPKDRDIVVSHLYEQIQDRDIWIPYGEVKTWVFRQIPKIVTSLEHQYLKLRTDIEAEHAKK